MRIFKYCLTLPWIKARQRNPLDSYLPYMFTSLHLQEIKQVPDPERGIMLILRGSNLRQGFPGGSVVKNPPVMQETWVRSWVRKIPWRRKCPPTPVLFPGKSQTEEPEGLQPMESLKSLTRTWLLSNNKSKTVVPRHRVILTCCASSRASALSNVLLILP